MTINGEKVPVLEIVAALAIADDRKERDVPDQYNSFDQRLVPYVGSQVGQETIVGPNGPMSIAEVMQEFQRLQARCADLEEKNRQLEGGSGLCSICKHGRGISTISVQLLADDCVAVTYPSGMPLKVEYEQLPEVVSLLKELVQLRRMGR